MLLFPSLSLLALAFDLASASVVLDGQLNISAPPAEATTRREYFYVGGEYVSDGRGGHVLQNQMYVEKLTSTVACRKLYPIVFIHGWAQTATNWLNKPDGSSGWASYYLNQGYDVYLLDQPIRGRSPTNPYNNNDSVSVPSAETISQDFTAPEKFNLWPQATLHTQWPGTGLIGSPYFDAFYATQYPSLNSDAFQQSLTCNATAQLLDRIGNQVILVSHSAGGAIPWLVADARPGRIAAIISLEPAGPPFFQAIVSAGPSTRPYGLTNIPLTYSPPLTGNTSNTGLFRMTIPPPADATQYLIPNCTIQAEPARKLPSLAGIPVLVVTSESSYHAPYDWCTVAYLRQAGVNTTHLQLGDTGVHGNGHLMFLERNSDEVAGLVEGWVDRISGGGNTDRRE